MWVSICTLFQRTFLMGSLVCLVASTQAHAWVDDFDGDSLHEDWITGLLSAGTGYSGGVSGGSLTVAPYGGSGWRGVSFERPYEADGDFSFSVDWSWSTGGYANLLIGVVSEDGSEVDTHFSDSHSGCSGETFSVRLDGESSGIGHPDCSGSGTTSISRIGDTLTISYTGTAGSASLSREFTEPIAAVRFHISEYSAGSVSVSIDRVEINCGREPDVDGDGHYSLECNGDDCDDDDASAYPGADEVCDDVDNDCDGSTDEEDAVDQPTWYADSDLDGYGDPAVTHVSCASPSGHVDDNTDCDDTDAAISPGADETCDEVDNDCDGTTDEDDAIDAPSWYADNDADGFGDAGSAYSACEAPSGTLADSTDCDDADWTVFPGAEETCDGADNDCDGLTDEDDASDASTWYADADGDGYGDMATAEVACVVPADHVADATDCDDAASAISPGADEICDGVDNDCDGTIDGAGAIDASTWYADHDGDGYGSDDYTAESCEVPAGFVADATDCDDLAASTFPGADETCDGADNDCDGATDEAGAIDASTWYADADSDGYGDPAATHSSCSAPSGHVDDATDCDDADASISPGADETCDGADNDCDGLTDEDDATDAPTWYLDHDSDGYGTVDYTWVSCEAPDGFRPDATDCDDLVATIFPGADETCDGVDNDCDGVTDEDEALDAATWYADTDADGFGDADSVYSACEASSGTVADSTDCDDSDGTVFPGADETCDGVDNDCDGVTDEDATDAPTWYADSDGDGYGDMDTAEEACAAPADHVADGTDCDDGASTIFPDAEETCDGVDNDCDGLIDEAGATDLLTWYMDHDGDGFGSEDYTTEACEAPTGFVADATDCDDLVATTHPDADEVCDAVDNDCDEDIDEDATDVVLFFADVDEDGFGDAESTAWACEAPEGYVEDDLDCDDADPAAYPGAPGWTLDCEPIIDSPDDTGDTGDMGDTGDTGDMGDTGDTGAPEDTGDVPVGPDDTGPVDTGDGPVDELGDDTGDGPADEPADTGAAAKGCGCASTQGTQGVPWLVLLGLLGAARSRSRRSAS